MGLQNNKSFQNFGEFLYYAYANLQMFHYALKDGKQIDYPQPEDIGRNGLKKIKYYGS